MWISKCSLCRYDRLDAVGSGANPSRRGGGGDGGADLLLPGGAEDAINVKDCLPLP